MTSLLSIREGESGAHKPKLKESTSSKALLFEKVREAEARLVFSGSDAVEESLVIIGPHGLNPKVKRLVLKTHCLTVLGYKTGKFNRQWQLEDIVRVKRHAINHNCFTITCLERKKKKIKNQKYSFEVKSEIECWRWIEVLNAAATAVLNEHSKAPDAPKDARHLSPSDSGTLRRNRSTSAPPLMAPPGVLRAQPQHNHPAGGGGKGFTETDDDEEEEHDPYADQTDEDDEEHQHGGSGFKEKEAEPYGRKNHASVSFSHVPAESRDSWASFQPAGGATITVSPPGTPMKNAASPAAAATFNPFGPAQQQQQQLQLQQQQAAQGGSPYSAHQQQAYQQHMHQQSMMQPLQPQTHVAQQQASSPYSAYQQQQQQASHYQSPATQVVASPPSPSHTSPPSSSGAAAQQQQQQQYKPAEAPKSAPSVYITTMSPPAHMRIVQDLGLLSATGTAAAPSSPNQCGAQVEAALQAARQELSLRAASRGANGVFQTSFSTAFHQWGVTVLACGTACVATMVTN